MSGQVWFDLAFFFVPSAKQVGRKKAEFVPVPQWIPTEEDSLQDIFKRPDLF